MNKIALDGVYIGYKEKHGNDLLKEKHPFKEMSVNDKINKQLVAPIGGASLRLNTIYNSEKGSRDENDAKEIKQNNFLKTGGFGRGTKFNY